MEGHADATQWEEYYSTRLKKMWKEEYTNREVPSLAMLSTAAAERGSLDMTLSWHSRSAITKGRIQRRPALDEYERYIHTFTPADDKYQFSPLSWWQEHQMKYPNLSQMAFDLLSIPTISAETERSFSSAGKMVSPFRTRLDRYLISDAFGCNTRPGLRRRQVAALINGYELRSLLCYFSYSTIQTSPCFSMTC